MARLTEGIADALRGFPRLYAVACAGYRMLMGAAAAPAPDAVAPAPLDESEVRRRLIDGEASLDEGLWLYAQVTSRGEPFALDLEERVLRLGIAADAERTDLAARRRQVLIALGRPVDDDVEAAAALHWAREEREQDHQAAAAGYHSATGVADMPEEFLRICERCREFTMTSVERMYALYEAARYIEAARIDGDVVECGVWRGGSMMVVAHTLLELGRAERDLYLFDTFEGLPRPDEERDVDVWGNRAIDGWLPRSAGDERSHWAEAGEEEVRRNLTSTGYPGERLHFVKGMVERTIPRQAPQRIALLRLDTDWYASTKHELESLYDRLSPNGVLILDDYGHFKGARQAVDEFFHERRITILLNRIDYSGRLGIKLG